jgi:lysophospholipase L1-like esterase
MSILIRTIFILALLLMTGACENRKLSPLPPEGVILAFGDSLTAGVGADEGESYPAVLAQLSGLNVVNAGIPGETVAAGQVRLPRIIDTHAPDLLLLLEGGNDILRNHDLNRIKASLAAMIQQAQSSGIDVVLIGVPEKSLFSDVAPIYAELAQEYELVFIPDLVSALLRTPEYKADRVHLNAAGYRAMAEDIHAVLRKHGALE